MSSNGVDNGQQCGGSGEMTSNKKERTSCEQDDVNSITKGINSVALLGDTSTCASCGKEGNRDNMNTCNKCKMVKYCNAACKKKHRSKHKKKCERRVAELYEEALFKDNPPREECPICFLVLPKTERISFQSCCGKSICDGCVYAMKMSEGGKDLCAFCRTPGTTTIEENLKRTDKLVDKGNGEAYYMLAGLYSRGIAGLSRDMNKANELLLKAGELGCANAYHNLGTSYENGRGVEVDMNKAKHYFEIAAMSGCIDARHDLGCLEGKAGNHHRAMKHFFLAARAGEKRSLDIIKAMFMHGIITKDEYASTLRAYHERQKEMKSEMRDKAELALESGMFH